MVKKCVGCGEPLTKVTISREHILPKWLAHEVNLPNQNLKHYLLRRKRITSQSRSWELCYKECLRFLH